MVRLENCSYEDARVKLQDCLCSWLADQLSVRARFKLLTGLVSGGAGVSRAGGCWPTVGTVSSPTTKGWSQAGDGSATPSAAAHR